MSRKCVSSDGKGDDARIVTKGIVYRLFFNLLFCILFNVTFTLRRNWLRYRNLNRASINLQFQIDHIPSPGEAHGSEELEEVPIIPIDQGIHQAHTDRFHILDELFP